MFDVRSRVDINVETFKYVDTIIILCIWKRRKQKRV